MVYGNSIRIYVLETAHPIRLKNHESLPTVVYPTSFLHSNWR